MYKKFNGFTAYEEASNSNLGKVDIYSNMLGLFNRVFEKGGYKAEIYFLETIAIEFANPFRLTLRKDKETWRLTGQGTTFLGNKLTISLSLVEYYIDGDEHIYWDVYKYIHRIHGHDKMKDTRINLGLE